MVRPASFGFNPDTAPSFMFQREITDVNRKEIERRARSEFDLLAGRLREAGADVIIVDDKEELNTPDAVFPNNWVSFHHDGTVVLYPMFAPSYSNSRGESRIRWCMPASRMDSPCRPTQRPTVFGRARSASAWWAKSCVASSGAYWSHDSSVPRQTFPSDSC